MKTSGKIPRCGQESESGFVAVAAINGSPATGNAERASPPAEDCGGLSADEQQLKELIGVMLANTPKKLSEAKEIIRTLIQVAYRLREQRDELQRRLGGQTDTGGAPGQPGQ